MKQYRIKLWELLAERQLKVSKVSLDTGISRPTLNSIFYGRSKGIQFDTINKLCDYLHITPGDLFDEVKPIKPVYPTKKAAVKTTAT
jgi:putative transcriptional regulator